MSETANALSIRREWMRMMGFSSGEIDEHCKHCLPTDIDVEMSQYDAMFDIHMVQVGLAEPQPRPKLRPIYAVSDLHLGDGSARDNFAHMSEGHRQEEFESFLDFVEEHSGQLLILGDMFELWQSNMSKVITCRVKLLDRLAKMRAIYILGNHDADLLYFIGQDKFQPAHPFFQSMRMSHTVTVSGRHFHFIHGHQVDKYCAGDVPGFGRISAIYSGIWEDRHGSPLLSKYSRSYRTVEAATVGRLERLITFFYRLCGKSGRFEEMNRQLVLLCERGEYDVLVSGHTHFAGKVLCHPVYNTGTWAEQTCSFVVVNQVGQIGIFDWVGGRAIPNSTRLKV